MALRKNINTDGKSFVETSLGRIENGSQHISFSAYIKVLSIVGTKNNLRVLVGFTSDEKQLTKQYDIPMSVEDGSANFIKQAYEYLKTLPEFSGATDC
jgi:hypothetical protein